MQQKKRNLQNARRRRSHSFNPLPRIEALTRNARTTLFTLLGVLLFVGMTIMGVEHIDFYGVDRGTTLPLVNIAVPTTLYLHTAPVLTAAVYIYFHLYLIRLFYELGGFVVQMRLRDSSRESSVIAGRHEQLVPYKVQDKELAIVQRSAEAARIVVDLV